ncbi:hypothetical protein CcI156_21415 [Frankia sp. CcI156]|jgi:hypothetical protein|nr:MULTISPECIES: hypothetical protein [unclassified Frankia]OFB39180.1 hypothetical protein Manayef4_20835 [Frankia sp. CgIM4]ONH22374.1 hypothetical protein CcI156_21415 [Frankia sp. CcI156]TFE27091.1 hypothetical protein E0F15_16975 [Frankia sp. B2]
MGEGGAVVPGDDQRSGQASAGVVHASGVGASRGLAGCVGPVVRRGCGEIRVDGRQPGVQQCRPGQAVGETGRGLGRESGRDRLGAQEPFGEGGQ